MAYYRVPFSSQIGQHNERQRYVAMGSIPYMSLSDYLVLRPIINVIILYIILN